jgi:hypothetical protein
MSPFRAKRILIVVAAALAASTYAQAARTREEVRAELADARHSGKVIATGEAGLTQRELYPQSYPAAASGTTRRKVIAELKEAQRAGDIVAAGSELGLLYPQRYTGIASMASAPMHATSSASAMKR